MKSLNKYMLVSILFLLIIVSFAVGYYTGDKPMKELENRNFTGNNIKEEVEIADKGKVEDLEIYQEAPKVTPTTQLDFITKYEACDHIKTHTEKVTPIMVNKTEENFKTLVDKIHSDWKVEVFDRQRIVIKVTKPHLCPEHFVIGIKDEKMALYKIDENGNRLLKYVYEDVTLGMLKKVDQDKLKKGIVIDDVDEIQDVLQDFGS